MISRRTGAPHSDLITDKEQLSVLQGDKMKYESAGQIQFFSEMSEHQISAREFFSNVLLDLLEQNFDIKNALIFYFDTKGRFLSWVSRTGILLDSDTHPYRRYIGEDAVRRTVFEEAVRDHLTYFDVEPRLYRSTALIPAAEYESSPYVRFMEENFHAHYSVTMAFGINAYIQVAFFKSSEQGDFTAEELEMLREIYVYIANSYKNFKKHEQSRIISSIQTEIIASGEKAYLVTDDFMHIMSYNKPAYECLLDILGPTAAEQLTSGSPCSWLPFLLGTAEEETAAEHVHTRVIQNYIFKIYTYDQRYSNKIVDRYHWITISRKEEKQERAAGHTDGESAELQLPDSVQLTQTEKRVAGLMYNGYTYKAIADTMVISYHTVKKHVENIYTKCGVNNRFQLCRWLEERK